MHAERKKKNKIQAIKFWNNKIKLNIYLKLKDTYKIEKKSNKQNMLLSSMQLFVGYSPMRLK